MDLDKIKKRLRADFPSKIVKIGDRDIESPVDWGFNSVNIVVQNYLYRGENSVYDLVDRVVKEITLFGKDRKYFTDIEAKEFYFNLSYAILDKRGSFNSPVWFNIGVPGSTKQASACFILDLEDNMESVLNALSTEARLFKEGSGSGINMSSLRASHEKLSKGGTASGPVSFMKVFDSMASTIKSGGRTRRAAKMVILNIGHPDIEEFITCKVKQEEIGKKLEETGFEFTLTNNPLMFQSGNNTVRVTDKFMEAVENNSNWKLMNKDGSVYKEMPARNIWSLIAESVWKCGDPGIQFHDTINMWNTCKVSGDIKASNPCSEYMFLNNSACNLASLNLMKYYDKSKPNYFNLSLFLNDVELFIMAQDILVDLAQYPTSEIAENSHKFRPLGLGFTNLGALLIAKNLPYDSDEARGFVSYLTSSMTAKAYTVSHQIAEKLGSFEEFEKNEEVMDDVLSLHRTRTTKNRNLTANQKTELKKRWISIGKELRNAQVTLIAPCGTISFMMGATTTGCEPFISWSAIKTFVSGEKLDLLEDTDLIKQALIDLGYEEKHIIPIIKYMIENNTIVGAPEVREKHYSIFATSLDAKQPISWRGHLKMMAAIQPYISGAISKTCNVPENISIGEIEQLYKEAWKLGLKSVTIYRDNSKVIQPINVGKKKVTKKIKPVQRKLPDMRRSLTKKFVVGETKGYITVGLYEDGSPGEIFITLAKDGSAISGWAGAWALATSLGLQYGAPLETFIDKFEGTKFEPSGFSPDIQGYANSVLDYVVRWLKVVFMDKISSDINTDSCLFVGDICPKCGNIMQRTTSTCETCSNCGYSLGCS